MAATEITVRVKSSTSEAPLEVRVAPSITVLQLKQKLSPLVSSPPAVFELLFGEDHLSDDRVLEDYHISDRTLLRLEYRQASIKVPIVRATGETTVISAEGEWTMGTLKARVVRQLNVPENSVKVLDDSEDVSATDKHVNELCDPQIVISAILQGG